MDDWLPDKSSYVYVAHSALGAYTKNRSNFMVMYVFHPHLSGGTGREDPITGQGSRQGGQPERSATMM